MKSRKGFILILVVLVSILLLSGCGEKADNDLGNDLGNDVDTLDTMDAIDTINFLVPYAAGGGNDRRARGLVPFLQDVLDLTIIVDNMGGAGGMIGMSHFINEMPKDGSSIFIDYEMNFSGSIATGAPYAHNDFAYLGKITGSPIGFFVNEDSPHETFNDLLQEIKDNPGRVRIGFLPGDTGHIQLSIMIESLDLSIISMPYDEGAGPARTALLGGHIDAYLGSAETTWGAHLEDFRTLMLFAEERHPFQPQVPTIFEAYKEAGINTQISDELYKLGVYMFIGTHAEVKENYPGRYEELVDALETVMADKRVQDMFVDNYWVPSWAGPDEVAEATMFNYQTIQKFSDLIID
jgi:tripartite-type tricarboxylate transporter receptor subunit TctC